MNRCAVMSVHPNSLCNHGSHLPCSSRSLTATRCSPMRRMFSAVSVSGNWRIVFRFEGDAYESICWIIIEEVA